MDKKFQKISKPLGLSNDKLFLVAAFSVLMQKGDKRLPDDDLKQQIKDTYLLLTQIIK